MPRSYLSFGLPSTAIIINRRTKDTQRYRTARRSPKVGSSPRPVRNAVADPVSHVWMVRIPLPSTGRMIWRRLSANVQLLACVPSMYQSVFVLPGIISIVRFDLVTLRYVTRWKLSRRRGRWCDLDRTYTPSRRPDNRQNLWSVQLCYKISWHRNTRASVITLMVQGFHSGLARIGTVHDSEVVIRDAKIVGLGVQLRQIDFDLFLLSPKNCVRQRAIKVYRYLHKLSDYL